MKLSDIKVGHKYKYWIDDDIFIEQVVEIGNDRVSVVIIKPMDGGGSKAGDTLSESTEKYLSYFNEFRYTRLKYFKEYADWDKG